MTLNQNAMKAVILAGGLGTRLSEETTVRPKPMVEIGGRPILWHIMKIYHRHGISDFVICTGYKGYMITEYFVNYRRHMSDLTVDLSDGSIEIHHANVDPWRITLVDTGLKTMTGGRLKRIRDFVPDDHFCMTYGDGVGDIDISALVDRHLASGKLATVTATRPSGRFGALRLDEADRVTQFQEKPEGDGGWINGGFFVLSKEVLDYIEGDQTVWERDPLERLAREGHVQAYRHNGFWQPMDTVRDRDKLEELWKSGEAPWKIW